MSRILPALESEAIDEAVRLLGEGRLVAVPTETVYGLAADATNGAAVASIFSAKGRPRFNPLIVHVATLEMAERYGLFDATARDLAERFWPGPLTIVVPAREPSDIHPLVGAGLRTLGFRLPQGVAQEVISRLGRPIAAPSANLSGKVSPTAAAHVARSLGSRVDLVLDGGLAVVGLESTIVKPEGGRIVLLRPGGIASSRIETATGIAVVAATAEAGIEAPGQMTSHYAPHGTLRLDCRAVRPGEWLIRFGSAPVEGEDGAAGIRQLSRGADLDEAAANLFSMLTELDRADVRHIAVMPIPAHGIGEAINDRLRRAAAPRDGDETTGGFRDG